MLRQYAERIQERITDGENWLKAKKMGEPAIFILFSIILFIICFVGQKPIVPTVQVGQRADQSIVAEISFNYSSKLEESQKIHLAETSVSPVYRLNEDEVKSFEEKVFDLRNMIVSKEPTEGYVPLHLTEGDMQILRQTADMYRMLQKALICFREISAEGIIDTKDLPENHQKVLLSLASDDEDDLDAGKIRSEFEAYIRFMEMMKDDFKGDLNLASVLGKIFSQGLVENLVYDADATKKQVDAKLKSLTLSPPKVVARGEEIVRRGDKITPEMLEKVNNYRKEIILATSFGDIVKNATSVRKILITCLIIFLAGFFARGTCPEILRRIRVATVFCTIIIIDLLFVRLRSEILQSSWGLENYQTLSSVLPYCLPQAFAALLLTTLCGSSVGILAAFIVSCLSTMIFGGNIEMFFTFLIPSFVGIVLYEKAQFRSNFIRAALLVGVIQALCILIFGVLAKTQLAMLALPTMTALASGILTGILIIGLLPVLEGIFAQTSDVRLQELTNYNHPLLRRLQLEAPGTYYHSMMVANLSENAALAVGANALICRVTSLFHDIGKLDSPEYFVENQVMKGGENPLLKTKPSMSALIIRRHVKDGVLLAKKYRLPRIIIDVIQQHHGTGLIKYFYVEALKMDKNKQMPLFGPNYCDVEESTYRYEGPKPQFLESTIVFFADSIEAATRSLPKINHHTVEELIERIFNDRIADNQLNDSPITFEQVNKIKESFIKTILTANHSRIEYPKMPEKENKANPTKTHSVEKHEPENYPAV